MSQNRVFGLKPTYKNAVLPDLYVGRLQKRPIPRKTYYKFPGFLKIIAGGKKSALAVECEDGCEIKYVVDEAALTLTKD